MTSTISYTTCLNFVQSSSGDRMWFDNRQCPHFNENCCSMCDFDRYYAGKHGAQCPWFKEDDD